MTTGSRGVALITALLVVAIATLAATALLSSTSIAIHRTAALRDSEQAWWVARGVESWVLGILAKDHKDNPNVDGLGEDWAQPVDYLPVDQGYVRGTVVDLQGRFNLNNLLDSTAAGANPNEHRAQFQRLLAAMPTELEVPPGLIGAIIDWADADQRPTLPAGAEDMAYLALDPPYRTADRPFTVVSELLAVQGMTPELYEHLRERVCALPVKTAPTKVNVNTADLSVLRALSKTPDDAKLQQFIDRRVEEPAQSIAEFNATGALGADASAYIATASDYFQIRGEVFVGSSRVALYSLIHRPGTGAPTVLAHSADAE